ncbi:MAG: 3-oxoadipate enol-lactonase [Rhodospirillales bacterium]|nr:3-oxoadipate enol-lactonase [Rhodospirillales bacterium]
MPHIEANGTKLFYDLTGPEEAPVVVFSNSLGTTLEMWDHVVRELASNFRCLRYDTCGHGRSPARTGEVTIRMLADDLVGLLDVLGIARAHVVGLSLGGMTAQSLAIHHPERVANLVLMATAPFLPPADNWHARAEAVRKGGMAAIVDAVMQRWFTAAVDPARLAWYRALFLGIDPQGYAAACLAIAAMDLRPALKRINATTLVVAGAEDPVTNVEMSRELAAGIEGARLAVVEGASHLIAIERPIETAALLRAFLPEMAPGADAAFQAGLANRKAVLGVEHVQRSLAAAGPFAMPWQDFITRAAWGETWGNPTLPWKTRSLVTLAMMVALGREAEFKLHVKPALKNGVSIAELQALLLHAAIYAGVPAVNGAFGMVREVLGSLPDEELSR